jgi:hypothetical protein
MPLYPPTPADNDGMNEQACTDFFSMRQLARASRYAPTIAFALGVSTSALPNHNPLLGAIIGGINGLLVMAGFLMAAIALISTPLRGARGVLGSALLGLALNGVMLAAFIYGFNTARAAAMARQQQALAKTETNGWAPLFAYPGWFGFARVDGALICISQVKFDSTWAPDEVADLRRLNMNFLMIAVDNTAAAPGASPISIDPSSIVLQLDGGIRVAACSPRQIMAVATSDRNGQLRRMVSARQIPAGGRLLDGVALTPPGSQFPRVHHITINVNGRTVDVPGRMFTAAEKAAMLKHAPTTGQMARPQSQGH